MAGGKSYSVAWTEAMANDAVNTYVLRRVVRGQKLFWIVALIMLALFMWLLERGDRTWVLGMAGVGASLPWLLLALVWTAHWRNTVGKLRRMPEPVGTVTFQPDGLAFDSGLGSGTLSWAALTDVWERPGYMMVFSGDQQFNIVPTEGMAEVDVQRLRSFSKRNKPAGAA